MTSPYTSSLLQQSVDTTAPHHAPQQPMHTRTVTQVVAAPAQAPVQYAPQQPQVVYAQPQRGAGGAISAVMLGLVVILVGAVALVGGYFATKQASPSVDEAVLTQGIAMREGYQAGRDRGVQAGREAALSNGATTSQLRIAAAREAAYSAALRRGERAGRNSYRAPRYTGYRSSYRAPSYSYGGGSIAQAFGQAQNLANLTGAPVDVEMY